MSLRLHLTNQIWKTVGHPSEKEKGSLGAVLFEEIQHFAGILDYSRRPILPRASGNLLSECLHLEVVLDINTQYVSYAQAFFCCA